MLPKDSTAQEKTLGESLILADEEFGQLRELLKPPRKKLPPMKKSLGETRSFHCGPASYCCVTLCIAEPNTSDTRRKRPRRSRIFSLWQRERRWKWWFEKYCFFSSTLFFGGKKISMLLLCLEPSLGGKLLGNCDAFICNELLSSALCARKTPVSSYKNMHITFWRTGCAHSRFAQQSAWSIQHVSSPTGLTESSSRHPECVVALRPDGRGAVDAGAAVRLGKEGGGSGHGHNLSHDCDKCCSCFLALTAAGQNFSLKNGV